MVFAMSPLKIPFIYTYFGQFQEESFPLPSPVQEESLREPCNHNPFNGLTRKEGNVTVCMLSRRSKMKIRVGVVDFLSVKPLIYGLEKDENFQLIPETPSRCAEMLDERKVDIAMLPSVHYASPKAYSIIPGMSISSKGAAGNMLLFSKKERKEIKTISIDRRSTTSSALLKILCYEKFDIQPKFIEMHPNLETMLAENDAALIIGDDALFAPAYFMDMTVADLGKEWYEMTSLPFVFAFWAGYPDLEASQLNAFLRSAQEGVKNLKEIALSYTFHGKEYPAISGRYLARNVDYSFGERERRGVELFFDLCLKHRLIEHKPAMHFYTP